MRDNRDTFPVAELAYPSRSKSQRDIAATSSVRNPSIDCINCNKSAWTSPAMVDNISEAKIKLFLQGIAENMESLSREALKDFLTTVIGQATLDPASHECQIDYRIGIN
ncbi:MAG TPA: hypothetical protein EYO59_11775, partial [Chromatiaceae bacterium]|nr:hypothetical protein [Chromatiaceae bacterium]